MEQVFYMDYELNRIRENIELERVSTTDILYLQDHKQEVLDMGDPVLCEWAGISEQEYNKGVLK